jgi:hypothetical protein
VGQDHYLMTETEVDRIRELLGSVHDAVLGYIESRRVRVPPWEEGPDVESCLAILEETQNDTQRSFDF